MEKPLPRQARRSEESLFLTIAPDAIAAIKRRLLDNPHGMHIGHSGSAPDQLRALQQICRAERRPSCRHHHERFPGTTSVHLVGRHASSPAPSKPCGPAAARCARASLVSTAPRDTSASRVRRPASGPPPPGPPALGPSCAGTHTQDAEPATGAVETFKDAQIVLPALSAGSTAADPKARKLGGAAPFTSELLALTLMALPD
jgi:hypothetical protein